MSTKILTIIDTGGNKKAAKLMITSFCSYFPEYVFVVIDAQ